MQPRLDELRADCAATLYAQPQAARRWRVGRRVRRYVLRELLFPTLFALGGLVLIAIAADLVAYSDLVINRGFGWREVVELALYRTLPLLGRMIPFAALLGPLVALGRLGADHELVALEASGVSPRRLGMPIAGFGLLLALVALAIATVGAPWANRRVDALLLASARHDSGTLLRSGAVNALGPWRIQAQEVSSSGDRLRGVVMFVPSIGETIFANVAEVAQLPGGDKEVRIEDGVVLRKAAAEPAYVHFHHMQQRILADEATEAPPADEWLASASLRDIEASLRSQPESPERRVTQAEWHRRFALPTAAACFGLLALPLFRRRFSLSRSGGAALGLAAVGVYFGLLQLSHALLNADRFPVPLAIWLPDAVLAVVAIALLHRVERPREAGREGAWRLHWRRSAREDTAPSMRHFVLDRYVGVRFIEIASLCFAAMLVAFVLIDVVDNLQWFTRYHSTLEEVARFYAARLPLLAARVVPMALLVGAALTVSLFGTTGELLAMRACGIAPLRAVVPIFALCIVAAVGYRLVIDQWVPHAAARATQIKRFEIKNQAERRTLWQRVGDRLYEVDLLDPLRGVARGLTIFEIGGDGFPHSRTDAVEARHVGKGVWELEGAERVEATADGPRSVKPESFVRLGNDLAAEMNSSGLSMRELRREIRHVERGGYDATPYRVDYQVRLASPIACLTLPALALLLALSGPPFPRPSRVLLLSAIVGAAHILLHAVGTSLGYGGRLPVVAAGWGPACVSLVAAMALALRLRAPQR